MDSLMSLPCEISVKCVLPVIRAMIAKELMIKHQLKQTEIAELLGISQPAISLYFRDKRGTSINLDNEDDITELIEEFAASLRKDNLSRRDFVCKFCEICKAIRAKGSICSLHKSFDQTINIEKCGVCQT